MSAEALLEILDRAHTGPVCTVHDWDCKVIPREVSSRLKEHGLDKTFAPDNPINTDDGLADEFYKAGFELATRVGMLCIDTERVVRITEEELKEALGNAPNELTIGEGQDKVVMRHRRPEDPYPPIACSSLGIVVSEDLFLRLAQGIAQIKAIDMIEGPSLDTVFGRPIRSGTPYETLAGRLDAQMHKEAAWRAGRPNIGFQSVITSPTIFGQLGGYGVPGGFDPKKDTALVLSPAELKTAYASLHKAAHALNCGGAILGGSWTMIGGYVGPAEGAAIASIACTLLQIPVHQASYSNCNPMDIRYMGNCGREGQWAASVSQQALARNTRVLQSSIANQVSGPCTEMILYESAVGLMNVSVSGAGHTTGPRSAGGKYTNYITPLECKFLAEVLKGARSMKRTDANEIAKTLIKKYEDKLKYPPKGKSFPECYDLKSLQPTKEWLDIYKKVKAEVVDLGLQLES